MAKKASVPDAKRRITKIRRALANLSDAREFEEAVNATRAKSWSASEAQQLALLLDTLEHNVRTAISLARLLPKIKASAPPADGRRSRPEATIARLRGA